MQGEEGNGKEEEEVEMDAEEEEKKEEIHQRITELQVFLARLHFRCIWSFAHVVCAPSFTPKEGVACVSAGLGQGSRD